MAAVSVIVVNWNAAGPLARCLASIAGAADEVVVVDNASTDGSADLVAGAFPWVRLLRHDTNLGFAGGVNAGAGLATGEHLLLLNPDAEATPGAVSRLGRFLEARTDVDGVAGRLVGTDGRPQHGWNVRRLPGLLSLLSELLLVDRVWPANPWRRHHLALDFDASQTAEVEQPAAACLMIRRAAFERLGGFDEQFFPAWFEDVDFCRRLRVAGGRLWYCPDAEFRHQGGLARDRLGRVAFAVSWQRNLERYVGKHHGRAARLLIKGAAIVGMSLRAGIGLAVRDGALVGASAAVVRGTLFGWRGAGLLPGRAADDD